MEDGDSTDVHLEQIDGRRDEDGFIKINICNDNICNEGDDGRTDVLLQDDLALEKPTNSDVGEVGLDTESTMFIRYVM